MRIIFNTWSHTDNNSPRTIGGEDQDRVVYGTELRVNDSLHFVPLMEIECVSAKEGVESTRGVAMETIGIWELRQIVLALWLKESFDVPHWLVYSIANSVCERKVSSLGDRWSH